MKTFMTTIGLPFVLLEGEETPEEIPQSVAYFQGKDGIYLKKCNKLYDSVTKCSAKEIEDFEVNCNLNLTKVPMQYLVGCMNYAETTEDNPSISQLAKVETKIRYRFTKMPLSMFRQIRSFFAEIYKELKSEVAILLYYNFETKEWLWSVPEQTVGPATVNYDESKDVLFVLPDGSSSDELPEGFSKMGTIHSHASMGAFHSGTDDQDEYNFDGLHITIGSFNAQDCTYSCRWIINGIEEKTSLTDVVEGEEVADFPEEITKLVTRTTPSYGYQGRVSWQGNSHYNEHYYRNHNSPYHSNSRTVSPTVHGAGTKKKSASRQAPKAAGVTLYRRSTAK
jgi:hypothetical protein